MWKKLLAIILCVGLILGLAILLLAQKPVPEEITYGMSFNTPYARELGLAWPAVYDAILNDLEVRHLRLAAHWPMVEPAADQYNWSELDYQIERAEEVGAEVILAVGRRLPRWPECHIPQWARGLSEAEFQAALLEYIEATVTRYRDRSVITVWQVENEPFLEVFAFEHCGELDVALLDRELALVRSLDPERPVLVTDSGNLGTWYGAYQRGDIFGTSMYIHFWHPEAGQFRTVLPPAAYRVKENLMRLRYGDKPVWLIELSAEPWLVAPVVEVPLSTQFTRMDLEKFEDIITYAEASRFDRQYLWGGEWWYWLKTEHDRPEMWERGKRLFVKDDE